MSGSTAISYQNNVLQTKLTYKGEGVDLVEAVRLSFDALDWKVIPTTIQVSDIELRWVQIERKLIFRI